MQKIKMVIFDFDGTIADTLPFSFKNVIKIARILKINNLSEKQIIKEIRTKSYRELMTLGGMKLSWFKLPLIMGIIRKMQEELYGEIETIKIFPGIKKLLKDLKKRGINLMILSSNLEKNVKKFLLVNQIDFFDFIDCGSHILGKAAAIDNLLKKNNFKEEKTVYVGDEIRDIEACKKIKMKIIAVSWGLNKAHILKKYGADFIVSKPSEILKIISS
ncbi:carotenoid oxygenase [Candidatus Roizmanbacteria bacterium CG02_land_8_20_14_3_00_36_15]|uniref:Carotenoid oxygenase n=2 Tax=Candidatus Roizmaniibacteriota TaxID=1752723 RepID=A0A2M8KKQ9_9BACT|nr:MAG: carotenoid oxygenase [Candidatus Roizmanbacteria bacterium CG03_land_8_20_14_0_80_36_21]PIV37594.1 MAG: carotenoid oxygenase [Candidatus Roizmanbacteria bacterium CG02_land_8_20_14_3_00_36_15]PIY69693.1 MAG: carotenoid oxygenase [Candidatus Roizmanbacteria bacterium CG_4_10_14_0_8_um_filter_36_36]PJA52386.1 MAG: carotenoid oxygenase [Candidatus Roizmanbacteria bacterium CG_4_9_14_3_um_filter_36_11]PJC81914.1 MAG: carotenoid oxygenase [Candidatus Roizmanbacteria bacterium CG_4_8_14_3_um_